MTAKHTPGPWRYDDFYVVHGEEGDVVCEVWVKDHEANAALIAAAPELLEALRGAQKRLRGAGMLGSEDDPVNAAIAKAEGRG